MRTKYILGLLPLVFAAPVRAEKAPPVFSLALRETLDVFAVPVGTNPGAIVLNKLQLSATLTGDRTGLPGWSGHIQIFRADGNSLSARLGDIQTADNIEALAVTRLFEAWVQKSWGRGDRTASLRAGLLDYNADFDSTEPAALFLNSSHGIGPDISKSGLNGPSIFPVSSFGVRASGSVSKAWTFRVAAYDGLPGDPFHPRRFATVKLRKSEGALIAAQADYHLNDKARVEVGAWRYTVPVVDTAFPMTRHLDQGIYASIAGPIQGTVNGWLRAGVSNHRVQAVSGYLGAGIVFERPFAGRSEDRFGIAVAHADVSGAGAETSIEATYSLKVRDMVALQPDVQYIRYPSGNRNAPDALAVGLRVVLTGGFPKKVSASEQSDPTIPPDGPQPPDQPDATVPPQ